MASGVADEDRASGGGATSGADDVLVECVETIDRSAEVTWAALRSLPVSAMPEGVAVEGIANGKRVRVSERVFMEQRVVERDDALMVLRMEMVRCAGLPWSAYRSRIRVEPVDRRHCEVHVTCLARPTAEAQIVEGMMRGLCVLGLRNLKAEVDQADPKGPPG